MTTESGIDRSVPARGALATSRRSNVGRIFRRYSAGGRLLTEFQAYRLSRPGGPAEVKACAVLASSGSLAIDVGASVGNFTRVLARAVGRTGRVLALEANPGVFEELARSTWAARVSAINVAVSSGSGWAELTVPVVNGRTQDQLASLERRDAKSFRRFRVRCIPLDDIVGAERVVSVIKVDVEGHESDVLAGAVQTIKQHRPSLVVEIEDRHIRGRSVDDVVGDILGLGYQCFGLRAGKLLPWESFDVDRDQRALLSDDSVSGFSLITHSDQYVNNFIFIAEGDESSQQRLHRRFGFC